MTHPSIQAHGDTPGIASGAADPALQEEARLDRAMEQADRLMIASLQQQERRRQNFRLLTVMGGLIMIFTLGLIWLVSQSSNNSLTPPVSPQAASARLDAAPQESAQQLSQEGWALWQKQQYDDAAVKFQAAVKQDPQLVSAWNGLGWSRFNGGRANEGLDAFKHALDLDPQYAASLNGMGQIYFVQNKLADAEKYLLKAAPQAPAAWWGLTKIYLLQSKWDDAKTYAQKIVDSGGVTGLMLDQAKAMLQAAKDHKLPDDLRQQITPPQQ